MKIAILSKNPDSVPARMEIGVPNEIIGLSWWGDMTVAGTMFNHITDYDLIVVENGFPFDKDYCKRAGVPYIILGTP